VNYTWFLPRLLFTKSYAFSNKTSLKPDVKSGLSLDIFIIDNVPDDRFWFKPWLFMVKVLVGMSKRNISFRNYSFFDKCVLMTFQIFNFCLPYKWQKALYKFLTQTVGKSYGYNCMILNHTVKGMSKIIPKGCFDGERYGELDGNSYPIPYDSERVLSILYGENYMDLPPLSMRKPHDFDIFKVSSDVL
jgi:phosphorylcholine metabolism protein LicD